MMELNCGWVIIGCAVGALLGTLLCIGVYELFLYIVEAINESRNRKRRTHGTDL